MPNPSILIWEGCEPTVQEAIRQLQGRWRPSSTGSSGHTLRLIEELVDPAISTCAEKLPHRYLPYIPGIGTEDSFSGIIRKFGLNSMALVQRKLLGAFRASQSTKSLEDAGLTATLETLIGLVDACLRKEDRKYPKNREREKTKVSDAPLNNTRRKGLCRFCGALAEFTVFADGGSVIDIYPPPKTPKEKQKTLRLSSQYCLDHRPKLANGNWNPEYQKAKRSEADFNLELKRLYLQSARVGTPYAESGNLFVDYYIYHYVRAQGFQPADESELRHHARLMVDVRLTDRKKAAALLQLYAYSQSDIARKLGVSRQQIFRDIKSIPDRYRQLPKPSGFRSYLEAEI